jgi:hypothetical protein
MSMSWPLSSPAVLAPAALRLLATARSALREAMRAETAPERYATAHLAALRAAASVLAARARPSDARARRPTSAWVLLAGVAPELGEWAGYFAAGADKRSAALAGLRSAVTAREADDLLRDATTFLALVETTLGLLPDESVSTSPVSTPPASTPPVSGERPLLHRAG